ncbi:MAG: type II toxin-antitoxin system HicB family antitoxin [Candidatus Blackburnbacteria bacterium]|nr:type II toxin-antitoxin system HicB family antitoxin [Candidatus Blackburnbacteria bacterium]
MANKKIKVLKYTAVFEPAEEGGYVVSVPALPGCVTEGNTFEEAVAMVKDAIGGYIAVLEEEGLEVPRETEEVVVTKVSVPTLQTI